MHERDSKFYRKFKPELPLSNPTTTYNKHRKRLLDCWDACEKSALQKSQEN